MPPDFGPEEFRAATGVSRETLSRLETYVELLRDWNTRQNLVSLASLREIWHRHVWDAAQLMALLPAEARSFIDLGSGAGFPALVLAILLRESAGIKMVLYEATQKKCAFLHAAARATGLRVEIRCARIEEGAAESFDVITARACASLVRLLDYAERFQGPNTVNLFLKGRSIEPELTEAHKSWTMQVIRHPSRTDPSGTILEIRELARAR